MTPYEEAAYRGRAKTDQDKRVEKAIVRNAVLSCLGSELAKKTLSDGTEVSITVAEELAAATIRDAIQDPDSRKLKDIASVAGEMKGSVDLNLRGASELFGDIANPEGRDG